MRWGQLRSGRHAKPDMSAQTGDPFQDIAGPDVSEPELTAPAAGDGRGRMLLGRNTPKLLKDLVSLVSGQFLSMVIGFATFAYLARAMSPEIYGAIEFAIAITAFATIVIESGAGTIGVREIARAPDSAARIAAQVPAARIAVALVVVPLVGFSGQITGQPAPVATMIWLFAISLIAIPFKQDWLLQAMEKMGPIAIAHPIRTLVLAVGVFILVRSDADIVTVGAIEIVSVFTVIFYVLVAQWLWTVGFDFRWPLKAAFYFLREGFSVGLSNMIWAFMLYAPMFLLVSMIGGAEPAWLGAAQRIVISLLTLSIIYHFNLYPVIARRLRHDREAWLALTQSSVRLVAWGAIGLALAVTLLSPLIMGIVFGSPFDTQAVVLAILIWSIPIRMLADHARWSLIAEGRQNHLLLAEFLGAAVLVVAGVGLIGKSLASGAAVAFVAGILTSAVIAQIFNEKLVGSVRLAANSALPLISALAGYTLAILLAGHPLSRAAIGIGVYVLVLALHSSRLLTDLRIVAYAKSGSATPLPAN